MIIFKNRQKHTIIIVAHRLSTTRMADKIIYIEDGTVEAEGTHEELWNNCIKYRELYEAEETRKN